MSRFTSSVFYGFVRIDNFRHVFIYMFIVLLMSLSNYGNKLMYGQTGAPSVFHESCWTRFREAVKSLQMFRIIMKLILGLRALPGCLSVRLSVLLQSVGLVLFWPLWFCFEKGIQPLLGGAVRDSLRSLPTYPAGGRGSGGSVGSQNSRAATPSSSVASVSDQDRIFKKVRG